MISEDALRRMSREERAALSRSLAACEGVILLVDASQGIQAQTLANCYLAIENDLERTIG